jgi:exonuclease III
MSVTPAKMLRLVSWNIGSVPHKPQGLEQRWKGAAERILDGDAPDLVLLQEAFQPRAARKLMTYLEKNGGSYELVACSGQGFKPVPYYVLFPLVLPALAALFWWMRQGGLLALRRVDSPWSLEGAEFVEYEEEAPFWNVFEGDEHADKGFQRITLRNGDASVVVFNTHLQAQYPDANHPEDGSHHPEVRLAQLRQISLRASGELNGLAVLAVGDWNIRPFAVDLDDGCREQRSTWRFPLDEGLYSELRRFWDDLTIPYRASLDCATFVGKPSEEGKRSGEGPQWLDYVLSAKDHAAVELTKLDRLGVVLPNSKYAISDHHGLRAEIKIPESSPGFGKVSRAAALATVLAGPTTRRKLLVGTALLSADTLLPIGLARDPSE